MLFTSPPVEPTPHPGPLSDPRDKPYDLSTEIPAAETPVEPPPESEFIMGPRQMASLAFVGILLLGAMSAIAYFAGRKNTDSPKITERVIERVVQAPAPMPAAKAPAGLSQAPAKPLEPAPVPPPSLVVDNQPDATVTTPLLNKTYLQAGSVEVGLAELMVEGLRKRGIPAITGTGINAKVARILVGPFDTPAELLTAQKKIEEMGFHPYPRAFTAKDLEQQPITTPDKQ